MLTFIEQLIRHKWWANSNLLRSIQDHQPAAQDPDLRKLLHHILVANRYWLLLTLGQTFIDEKEKHIPESHIALTQQFIHTESLEMEWLSKLAPADLDRPLQPRALPDITLSVAQAATQVALHSQGHRSQCATRLRALGDSPAPMDFVLWIRDHRISSKI